MQQPINRWIEQTNAEKKYVNLKEQSEKKKITVEQTCEQELRTNRKYDLP